jgi:hypothetical protein
MKQFLSAAALMIGFPTLCLAEEALSDDQAIEVIEAYWGTHHCSMSRWAPLTSCQTSRRDGHGRRPEEECLG